MKSKNQKIERWFDTNIDSDDEKEEKAEEKYPDVFHIEEMWKYLTLLDVIMLAGSYKATAYLAWYNNISGFATFCESTWTTERLDLRVLPMLKSAQMKQILFMFIVDEIIFPPNIPYDTLDYISRFAKKFTFHISESEEATRLLRPNYRYTRKIDLTIIGDYFLDMRDATIDLLITFSHVGELKLKRVYFSKWVTNALQYTNVQHLKLIDCIMSTGESKNFATALLTSKNNLEMLEINANNPWGWINTIYCINRKIHLFRKIKVYNIPLSLKENKLETFKILERSKSLKYVSITNMVFEHIWAAHTNYESTFKLNGIKVTIKNTLLD